jgi:hypothetical protein
VPEVFSSAPPPSTLYRVTRLSSFAR